MNSSEFNYKSQLVLAKSLNFSDKKIKEPEDNMRYAEKKAVRLMNNGLNNEMDTGKLNRREKRDRELLKMMKKFNKKIFIT